MSLRILGGLAKGFQLSVPKGHKIRPTSVILRRKIFDANQNLEGWVFVDLCAGTGAMGLEALSRGAIEIYLIENSKKVYGHLKRNVSEIRNKYSNLGDIHTYMGDGQKWLNNFMKSYDNWSAEKKQKTLIFIDPPYALHNLYKSFIDQCVESGFKGVLWIESDDQKGLPQGEIVSLLGSPGKKAYYHSNSYILIYDTGF